MLFKKISNLLLGIIIGLVLLPDPVNVIANEVINNTQNSIVSRNKNERDPSEKEPLKITSETTEEDFIKGINESGLLMIVGRVQLTKKVVDAIEEKTKKEELVKITISNNSSLVIGDDVTSLNINDYFLEITRDEEMKGPLVKIETNNSLTINGILVTNNDLNEPMFDMGSNTQVTFNSCKFSDGILDRDKLKDGIKFNFTNKIIGQDYVTLSGVLNTFFELEDLNVQLTVGNISNSRTIEKMVKADKIGNGEYKIEDLTFNDLQSGYSYFVSVALQGKDKQNNEYSITESDGLLDVTFNVQLNTFNFERSRLDSNSVTFDVFFGTNGSDKNGTKQYPLTFEIREESGNVKEKLVLDGSEYKKQSYTINNLSQNTNYIAVLFDNLGNEISRQTFKTLESNSGSSFNNKTEILSITSTDITRSDILDTNISILLSNQTLIDKFKKSKDFSTNIEGTKVSFNGTSRLEIEGLVPNKIYKNMTISYKDENSVTQNIDISQFRTKNGINKLRDFVSEAYINSLDRDADEVGFAYWVNEIENKTISPQSFVLNLLSENEFIDKNKTVDDKIKGLYRVIVNRYYDDAGFEFWTNRYKELFAEENNDSLVLIKIANEMVNSDEFTNLVKGLFADTDSYTERF